MYTYEAKKINYIDYVLYAIICTPIYINIKTVYEYALNMPREDEYDAVLGFFINYIRAPFWDKFAMIFSQQGEHRSAFSKIFLLLHYYVFGDVNFRHICLFNLVLIIAGFVLIVYFIKKAIPNHWKYAAIILSFNLFDLNSYENAVFGSSGLMVYAILLMFLLSIYLYSLKKFPTVILAALVQALCIFSGGNGMVASFFVVVFAFLTKDRRSIIVSTFIAVVLTPLYFYHFTNTNVNYHTSDATIALTVFLNALGGIFTEKFGFLCGVILSIVLIFVIPFEKKFKVNIAHAPLIVMTGFAVASLATMAVFRGEVYWTNMWAAYSSRYLIYSHIFVSMILLFLIFKNQNNRVLIASIVFAATIYTINYKPGREGFQSYYNRLKTEVYAFSFGQDHAKEMAEEACKMKFYCIEKHRKD